MAAVMGHSSLPPVVTRRSQANSTPSIGRRVPPPSYLNANASNKKPNSSVSINNNNLYPRNSRLTRTMQENVMLMSRAVEPEFENALGNPGKYPDIMYGRLVDWASHRDRISQSQPKIETWNDVAFEQTYRRQQKEAWCRDRLRNLEEIARKNTYANRLLAGVKPSFQNRLTTGDERMRQVVFHNKISHKGDIFKMIKIQQENEQLSSRVQKMRTSFDFKKMEDDFQHYMKRRNDRMEYRKRQEQREIDQFVRSRSSSCMSNRSSDRGSVMSTMSGKFVKKNGKWPGMLHERTVSDECLALTRPPQVRGRRRNRMSPPPQSTRSNRSKLGGSNDHLASSRSQRSNQQQSASTSVLRTNARAEKPNRVPPQPVSNRGTKAVIPPIKSQTPQRIPSRVYGSHADAGDGDTLVRTRAGAPTPIDQRSRNIKLFNLGPQEQRRKRDSSVDSSTPSVQQSQRVQPLLKASSQTTVSRSSVTPLKQQKPASPPQQKAPRGPKGNEEAAGELLAILLQTSPAPIAERENDDSVKSKPVRKASAESAASNSTAKSSKSNGVIKPAHEEPEFRYVGSSSSSEASKRLNMKQETPTTKPVRASSSTSSASAESSAKAMEPSKKAVAAERQGSGSSSHLSSSRKTTVMETKAASPAPATVGWAQKGAVRQDSSGSFLSDLAEPHPENTKPERQGSAQSRKSTDSATMAKAVPKEPVTKRDESAGEGETPGIESTWGVTVVQRKQSAASSSSETGKVAEKQMITRQDSDHSGKSAAPATTTPKQMNLFGSSSSSEESSDEKPEVASARGTQQQTSSVSPKPAETHSRQDSAHSKPSTRKHSVSTSSSDEGEAEVKPMQQEKESASSKASRQSSAKSRQSVGVKVTTPLEPKQAAKSSSSSSSEESDGEKSKAATKREGSAASSLSKTSKKSTLEREPAEAIQKEQSASLEDQGEGAPKPALERLDSTHSKRSVVPPLLVTEATELVEAVNKSDETARDEAHDEPSEITDRPMAEREPSIASSKVSTNTGSVRSTQSKKSTTHPLPAQELERKPSVTSIPTSTRSTRPGIRTIDRQDSIQSKKSTMSLNLNRNELAKVGKSESVSSVRVAETTKTKPSPAVSTSSLKPQALERQDSSASKKSVVSKSGAMAKSGSQQSGLNVEPQRKLSIGSTASPRSLKSQDGETELIPQMESSRSSISAASAVVKTQELEQKNSPLAVSLNGHVEEATDSHVTGAKHDQLSPAISTSSVKNERALERQDSSQSKTLAVSTSGAEKLLNTSSNVETAVSDELATRLERQDSSHSSSSSGSSARSQPVASTRSVEEHVGDAKAAKVSPTGSSLSVKQPAPILERQDSSHSKNTADDTKEHEDVSEHPKLERQESSHSSSSSSQSEAGERQEYDQKVASPKSTTSSSSKAQPHIESKVLQASDHHEQDFSPAASTTSLQPLKRLEREVSLHSNRSAASRPGEEKVPSSEPVHSGRNVAMSEEEPETGSSAIAKPDLSEFHIASPLERQDSSHSSNTSRSTVEEKRAEERQPTPKSMLSSRSLQQGHQEEGNAEQPNHPSPAASITSLKLPKALDREDSSHLQKSEASTSAQLTKADSVNSGLNLETERKPSITPTTLTTAKTQQETGELVNLGHEDQVSIHSNKSARLQNADQPSPKSTVSSESSRSSKLQVHDTMHTSSQHNQLSPTGSTSSLKKPAPVERQDSSHSMKIKQADGIQKADSIQSRLNVESERGQSIASALQPTARVEGEPGMVQHEDTGSIHSDDGQRTPKSMASVRSLKQQPHDDKQQTQPSPTASITSLKVPRAVERQDSSHSKKSEASTPKTTNGVQKADSVQSGLNLESERGLSIASALQPSARVEGEPGMVQHEDTGSIHSDDGQRTPKSMASVRSLKQQPHDDKQQTQPSPTASITSLKVPKAVERQDSSQSKKSEASTPKTTNGVQKADSVQSGLNVEVQRRPSVASTSPSKTELKAEHGVVQHEETGSVHSNNSARSDDSQHTPKSTASFRSLKPQPHDDKHPNQSSPTASTTSLKIPKTVERQDSSHSNKSEGIASKPAIGVVHKSDSVRSGLNVESHRKSSISSLSQSTAKAEPEAKEHEDYGSVHSGLNTTRSGVPGSQEEDGALTPKSTTRSLKQEIVAGSNEVGTAEETHPSPAALAIPLRVSKDLEEQDTSRSKISGISELGQSNITKTNSVQSGLNQETERQPSSSSLGSSKVTMSQEVPSAQESGRQAPTPPSMASFRSSKAQPEAGIADADLADVQHSKPSPAASMSSLHQPPIVVERQQSVQSRRSQHEQFGEPSASSPLSEEKQKVIAADGRPTSAQSKRSANIEQTQISQHAENSFDDAMEAKEPSDIKLNPKLTATLGALQAISPMRPDEEEESAESDGMEKPSGWGKAGRHLSTTSESSADFKGQGIASQRVIPPTPTVTAPTPAAISLRAPLREDDEEGADDDEESEDEEQSMKGFGKKRTLTALSGKSSPSAQSNTLASEGKRKGSASSSSSSISTKDATVQPQQIRPNSAASETRGSVKSSHSNKQAPVSEEQAPDKKSVSSAASSTKSTPRADEHLQSTPPTPKAVSPVAESRLEEEPEVIVTTVSANRPTIERTVNESDDSSTATSTTTSRNTTPRSTPGGNLTAPLQKQEPTLSPKVAISRQSSATSASSSVSNSSSSTVKNNVQTSQANLAKTSVETTALSVDTPKTTAECIDRVHASTEASYASSNRQESATSSDEEEEQKPKEQKLESDVKNETHSLFG